MNCKVGPQMTLILFLDRKVLSSSPSSFELYAAPMISSTQAIVMEVQSFVSRLCVPKTFPRCEYTPPVIDLLKFSSERLQPALESITYGSSESSDSSCAVLETLRVGINLSPR